MTNLNLIHFKKFGSIVFALVPSQQRRKLDEKSIKHIFVGTWYSEGIKGYKIHYNSNSKKIIINHDVIY